MEEARDAAWQQRLGLIASVAWWLVAPHLSEDSRKSFTPETILKSLPGYKKGTCE